MSADIGFDAQAPSLPAGGGGAVGGLGETFTPDLSTGTGTFAIRLDCPNGPNDIGPRLVLRYDTGSGNGPFGMGFSLPLARLLRSTARGFPRYDDTDTLMLEGAGELIRLGGGAFRPRVDAGIWRAESDGDGFRATTRDGLVYVLGADPAARLSDPAAPGQIERVYAWHLERIEDALGNAARFTWLRDGGQLYLARVTYGVYELRFTYAPRPDVLHWGRAGFPIETALRCATIELHLPADPQSLVRRWTLDYTQDPTNGCSLLSAVTLSGVDAQGEQLDAPTIRLGYSTFQPRTLTRFRNQDDSAPPGPLARPGRRVELVDWDGDGLPDLLEIGGGGQARLWPNLGECTWGRPRSVGAVPLFASPEAPVGLADLDGDGVSDLIRVDRRLDGYVPRRPASGFDRPVTWRRAPGVSLASPETRLVDLNGDGVVDLLASSEEYLALYYRADDGDGWSERPQVVRRGDAPDVSLADPHVSLADMTGDGSRDLVRIDGHGVIYWPYLGWGRWGAPVVMEHPPELPFDVRPESLFVVDLDGDGCADLLYVDRGRARYWINQSGNRFSDPREVDYLPPARPAELRVADMRGSGGAGLLWSTDGPFGRGTVYEYLDFGGGSMPYLLSTIDNGIGLTTTIEYRTSAQEAARDVRAGQPWPTTLPIAVAVVARITATDAVTGQHSETRYRYHDGRYDGVLREFAGFGRVEEEQVGDESIPTLLQTTRFHVGLDPAALREPRTLDERHRLRALRGRMLRRERYGLDGAPDAGRPYDRHEQAWNVVAEPTTGGTVYLPRLVSTVQSIVERAETPAAIVTTTNLAWDADGNVTSSVQRVEAPGDPAQTRELRTTSQLAADPNGRFRAHPWRVQQRDDAGAIVADAITEYDHAPEGIVGAQGLITRRSALVLTDEQVANLYAADPPDLAALGYRRRPGESGWWSTQASYQRVDDEQGLRGSVAGPRGATTTIVFDANRTFPTRIVDPCGNAVAAEHDYRVSRCTRLTDAAGVTTLAAYDALSRLVASIEPGDSAALPTTAFGYDTDTLPVTVSRSARATSGQAATIDSLERVDGAGRLLERRVRDDAGEIVTTSTRYNARGLPARTYLEYRPASPAYAAPDDDQPHTAFFYDAIGRLIRRENPDGSVRRFTYGPGVVEEADEEDTRTGPDALHADTPTRRLLDASGRVRTIEEWLGGRTVTSTYAYDLKGSIVRHVDALGDEVRFSYDLLGRTLRVVRPEHESTSVLDAAGNPVEARGRGGLRVFREHDACNRLAAVRVGDPNAAPIVRYTYHDAVAPAPPDAGLHTVGGRLVRIDDEAGVTIFDYDERGHTTSKRVQPPGFAQPFALDLAYRADGQLSSITYPDDGNGRLVVRYEYDRRGQVSRVPTVASAIEYDLAGRRRRWQYANGVEQTVAYDPLTGRPTERREAGPGGVLRSTQHIYDLVGNPVRIDSPDPKLAASYRYDDLYRLVEASLDSGEQWTYAYDDAGNLTHKSDVGDYRYGEGGAPSTCLTTAGPQTFTYTALGEMAATPWGTQIWDAFGQLTRIDRPNGQGQIDFRYDHVGRRVAAEASGGADPASTLLTPDPFYSIESGSLVLNLFDGEALAARQQAGSRAFVHADHLGGLALVTNAAGQPIETLRYDPYGQVLERTGAGPATPIGFTGGTPEPATGLLYLQARYYHPTLGRFVSPDAIVPDPMDPIAWSPYVYCRDNPTAFVDPSGRKSLEAVLAAIGMVILMVGMVILSVATAGSMSPLAAAVTIGVVSGGVVGGIATYRAHGNLGDLAAGVLVGAALGGLAAFGGHIAAGAIAGAVQSMLGGIVAGATNGLINGAALGLASAFAGGKGEPGDLLWKLVASAAVGMVVGLALGALARWTGPEKTFKEDVSQAASDFQKSQAGSQANQPQGGAPGAGASPGAGGASPSTSVKQDPGEAAGKLLGEGGKYVAGVVGPHAAHGIAGAFGFLSGPAAVAFGPMPLQTLTIDVLSGGVALYGKELRQLMQSIADPNPQNTEEAKGPTVKF